MNYKVQTIKAPEALSLCPVFRVDQYNWGGDYRPVTIGRLGFLAGSGFLLEMECREADPCRTFQRDGDPVYLDSAMEAFFCFSPEESSPCYLNFEMNACGALLAGSGRTRQNRTLLSKELRETLTLQTAVEKDVWRIRMFLPLSLIRTFYPGLALDVGSTFTCNFYKIKESEGRTHFASFAPIQAPEPNFHLPEYFASAQIVD